MRLQWTKRARRWLGGFLALVMIAGILVECVPRMPQVRAASEEPVYDAATGEQLYSNASVVLAAGEKLNLGVEIPKDETYWASFTIKAEGTANETSDVTYFRFRGNGETRRLAVFPGGKVAVYGDNANQALGVDRTVTEPRRITVESTDKTVSVWVDGVKLIDGSAVTGDAGQPFFISNKGASLENIQVWKVKKEEPLVSDEPTYSEAENTLLNEGNESLTVAAGAAQEFGVTVPADETYWMSFTLKGTGAVFIPYREKDSSGSHRLYMEPYWSQVFGTGGSSLYGKSAATGMDGAGAKVTVESTPTTVSVWLNGMKIVNQEAVTEPGEGKPRVSSAAKGAEFTGLQIWTVKKEDPPTPPITDPSEPTYNAATDDMKYTGDAVTVTAESSHNFGVTIPENETYWVTFTAKGTGTMYFPYRGTGGDGSSRLSLQAFWSQVTGPGNASLYDQSASTGFDGAGTKITIESTPDTVSVWMNGRKIVEKAPAAAAQEGLPQVSWATDGVELTDIRIWAPKSDRPVPEEPAFDKKEDSMLNNSFPADTLTLEAGENFHFTTRESGAKTFYFSFTARSEGELWVNYRDPGRLYLGQTQYGAVGLAPESWKPFSGLKDGVKVTIVSTPEHSSIWLDGKLVVEEKPLKALAKSRRSSLHLAGQGGSLAEQAARIYRSAAGGFIMPSISANSAVELSDIQLWVEGESSQNLDAPVYTPSTDTGFPVKGVSGGTMTADGIVVEPESASAFLADLPYNADYNMSMRVTSEGSGAKSVNIRFRGSDSFLVMNQSGYQLILGGEATEWINWPLNMKYGVDVAIRSSQDRLQVWLDGYKIYDLPYTAGGSAQPGILWSYDNTVTAGNLTIWANETPESDAPVFDGSVDQSYEIWQVTQGSYADGVLTVPAQSQAILLSDLPHNASYYMSMTLKTDGAVNLLYRDGTGENQGLFTLSSSGYQSSATGDGQWVNKAFYTLSMGAKVTWYSSPERFIIWVDGEKLVDDSYDKGGAAQPAIMWSFDNEVTASDLCLWTKEEARTDEPAYQPGSHVQYPVKDYGNGSWRDGALTVDPLKNAYFATDLSAQSDYFMSFVVQTTQAVNVMYRNPNGMFQLSTNGYISVGTDGEWVNKAIRKLPYGVRVTVHSTPDWITIWVDGEKLIDEPYKRAGESSPGIAWSFENGVQIRDIQIWTEQKGVGAYLGEILKASRHKLSRKLSHGAGLPGRAQVQEYLDQQPMGKSVQKLSAENAGSSYQIFEAEVPMADGLGGGARTVWMLAVIGLALLGVSALVVILIHAKRKSRRAAVK